MNPWVKGIQVCTSLFIKKHSDLFSAGHQSHDLYFEWSCFEIHFQRIAWSGQCQVIIEVERKRGRHSKSESL